MVYDKTFLSANFDICNVSLLLFFQEDSSEKRKYFYAPAFDGFYCNRLAKLVLQKIAAYVTGATFNRFVRFLNEAQRHQVLPETPRGEASFVKGRTIEDVECFI